MSKKPETQDRYPGAPLGPPPGKARASVMDHLPALMAPLAMAGLTAGCEKTWTVDPPPPPLVCTDTSISPEYISALGTWTRGVPDAEAKLSLYGSSSVTPTGDPRVFGGTLLSVDRTVPNRLTAVCRPDPQQTKLIFDVPVTCKTQAFVAVLEMDGSKPGTGGSVPVRLTEMRSTATVTP